MADNFGLKLGIEGEREFKNSLREINDSFRVLKSEMNLVSSQFDKNDKSERALTEQNKVLSKSIDEQKEKIATLEKALENARNSFGENDSRTKNWAMQLNNAKAELNGMEKELQKNEETAKKTTFSLKKMGDVLKTAGKIMAGTVAAVGAGVAGAGTAIVSMARKTSETSAEINNMSQKVGMSVEGFQKWSYILSKSGTDASILQGGMKKLSDAVVKAGEGNDAAIEKFKKLGISVEELKGMNQEQIFERVVTGLQGMGAGAERTSLATSLLGKSATELGPLLNKDSSDMEKLTGNLNKYGLVMDEDVVKANVVFKGSISNFGRVISATTNSLISELVPGMAQVVDGFTDLIMGVDGADEEIKQGIENIAKGIDSALPKLVQMISDIVENILKVAPEIISTLGTAIVNELPKLVPTAVQLIVDLCRMIVDALPLLVQGAAQIIIELAHGISQALPELIPTIIDVVIEVVETLIDNVDMLLEAALEIILALAEGLIKSLPKLIDKLPMLVSKIVVALIKCLPKIGEAALELVLILGKGIVDWAFKIGSSIGEFMDKVKEFFMNGVNAFLDVGKNIVKGLWDGVCAMGDWIKGKLKEFMSGIVNGVKDLLGIHSPSKVFFDIGNNMGEGLELGFENSMKDAEKTIRNAIPTEFKTDLDASIRQTKLDSGMSANLYTAGRSDILSVIFSELKNMNDSMYEKFVAALVQGVSVSVDNREIARLVRRYA